MDFSDERYVRVYTRDTATWECLEWDGQCVFTLLMRKVDRAGVLDFGDGNTVEEAVKAVTRLPLHVVEGGLPKLLKHKVLTVIDQQVVITKFIEAQEAVHSEKFRSREYRAKRRDLRRRGLPDIESIVTKRDGVDRSRDGVADDPESDLENGPPQTTVTKRDVPITKPVAPVTRADKTVTPSLAVPSRADLSGSGASQTKPQTRGDARAGAGAIPDIERDGNGFPIQPRRKTSLLNAPVSAEDYEPMPEHEAYALGLGLTRSEYQVALDELVEKTRKRGAREVPPSRLDSWLCGFIEAAAQSKTRVRGVRAPKLTVVAQTVPVAPYVPSTSNNFDGPIARLLLADDDDEDEGKEA